MFNWLTRKYQHYQRRVNIRVLLEISNTHHKFNKTIYPATISQSKFYSLTKYERFGILVSKFGLDW